MKHGNRDKPAHLMIVILLTTSVLQQPAFAVKSGSATLLRPDWERKEVNWRGPGGLKVKAVRYPQDRPVATLTNRAARRPARTEFLSLKTGILPSAPSANEGYSILSYVIDSPPIDGYVPWIAVGITDARDGYLEYIANTEETVTGDYLTSTPETNYALGIFDTGAGAHTISAADAAWTGIVDEDLVTTAMVTLTGATGDVNAWVSQPLGVFFDGLDAIDTNTLEVNDLNMVGQSNVSIVVGDINESPNMPTVVGCPLAVYFTTVIKNSQQITLNVDGQELVGPQINVYPHNDPRIPSYPNKIYLELRPTDGEIVAYFPCIEIEEGDCPDEDGDPILPSTIWGFMPTQSLLFASRTDLLNGIRTSQENKFMLDTGAEITVISELKAAELELNTLEPDFEVEIMGIAGNFAIAPGFFIDQIEITATPQWLSFTNVPVIMLDIASPEGGILDGILGTNLFADMNYYIRGGGLTGQEQPYIKFDFLPPGLTGDIAPVPIDGVVDILDLAALADAWLANPLSSNWNSRADIVGDAIIDFLDFAAMAQNWEL